MYDHYYGGGQPYYDGGYSPPAHDNPDNPAYRDLGYPPYGPHPLVGRQDYLTDIDYQEGLARQQIQDQIGQHQIASLYASPPLAATTATAGSASPAPPKPLSEPPPPGSKPAAVRAKPRPAPAPSSSSSGWLVALGILVVIGVFILIGAQSDPSSEQESAPKPLAPIPVPTQATLICEGGMGNAVCGATTPIPHQGYGSETGLYLSVQGITYGMMAHLCSMGYADVFFINGQPTGQPTCNNLNQSAYLSVGWRINPQSTGTWNFTWKLLDPESKPVLASTYTTTVTG